MVKRSQTAGKGLHLESFQAAAFAWAPFPWAPGGHVDSFKVGVSGRTLAAARDRKSAP